MHLEKKALRSLKLLEKVEHFGIENTMATTSSCRITSPLALYSSNLYNHRLSPMLQLTSLKHLAEKRNSDENLKAHLASIDDTKSVENSRKHQMERKMNRFQRQRSRRNIVSSSGQIRQDLGTVNLRPDLNKTERQKKNEHEEEKSLVGEFVGTISSLLFGRKGGLL